MVNINPMSPLLSSPESERICEQVFAEIILGRPSANCKHLGICKMERIYSNDFYSAMLDSICDNSNKLYALATLEKGHYFELTFQRAFMDSDQLADHFKNGIFVMEEDYYLDKSFFDKQIRLRSGSYKVQISDRLLTVRFDNI